MIQKIQPIIYCINASGAMSGTPINSINTGMKRAILNLKDLQNDYLDRVFSVGVMIFNSQSIWLTDSLIPVHDFQWIDLEAFGLAQYGDALMSIQQRFSRHGLFDSPQGYYTPIIVFIVEGFSTDDYKKPLDKLRTMNEWFKTSRKVVISLLNADSQMAVEIADHNGIVYNIDSYDNPFEVLSKTIENAAKQFF